MIAPTSIITVTLNTAIDCVFEVPGLEVGRHLKGVCNSQLPAGKGINVARAVSRLGIPCRALGFVGKHDMNLFQDELDELGCEESLIPVPGMTRRNITLHDPDAHTETHIRDLGFDVSSHHIETLLKILQQESDNNTIVAFSGSLPKGMTEDDLDMLVEDCLNRHVPVVMDTSGEPLRRVCDKTLWLIKPNQEELAEIAGRSIETEEDFLQAGQTVASQTGGLVLASWGQRGGFMFLGDNGWKGHVDMVAEEVIGTVGCGDAMLAGFLAGTVRGEGLEDVFKLALATAAASTRTNIPADFDRTDLAGLLNYTTVERLP